MTNLTTFRSPSADYDPFTIGLTMATTKKHSKRLTRFKNKWLQYEKGRFYHCFWQVLKKHPDFDCCLALKCLALMRLGRETEASTILDKVVFQILTKQQPWIRFFSNWFDTVSSVGAGIKPS